MKNLHSLKNATNVLLSKWKHRAWKSWDDMPKWLLLPMYYVTFAMQYLCVWFVGKIGSEYINIATRTPFNEWGGSGLYVSVVLLLGVIGMFHYRKIVNEIDFALIKRRT